MVKKDCCKKTCMCPICNQDKLLMKVDQCTNNHYVCEEDLRNAIINRRVAGLPVICPVVGCGAPFNSYTCNSVTTDIMDIPIPPRGPDEVDRYMDALHEEGPNEYNPYDTNIRPNPSLFESSDDEDENVGGRKRRTRKRRSRKRRSRKRKSCKRKRRNYRSKK